MFDLLLSVLCLNGFSSVNYNYGHFIQYISDNRLKSYYFTLNESKIDLSQWIKNEIPASFFYSTSAADVQQNVADLRSWAVGTGLYDNKAIQDFNSSTVADPYLAGYAATDSQNIKVVTNEKAGTGSKHSVKLPDACAQKGVSCLRIMEMLREMGETF